MKNKLIILAIALVTIVGSFIGVQKLTDSGVGVDLPDAIALFETSLAAPITSSATSMTLTSGAVRGGGSLSLFNCFTVDEGSSQAEFICGDVSGTTVTNLERGLSPSDGKTEVAALKFAHRRGASVKITDFPVIQRIRGQANGSETFENVLSYASSVVPSGADELADVGYVLSVVTGGAVSFDQLIVSGEAGETFATGTIVYFNQYDQEWLKADVDTASTSINVPIGIAQSAGTDNTVIDGGVLIMGRDTTQVGMTIGDDIYLSGTAGATTSTETAVLLGRVGDDTTELYFNPNPTYTLTSAQKSALDNPTVTHTYTANDTWTKPANLQYVRVQVWGGGGSGARYGSTYSFGIGAGGGGGGYIEAIILAADLGATEAVTIGAGGAGVSTGSPVKGNSGGTSSFGSLLSAYGGGGGGYGQTSGGGGSGASGGGGGGANAVGGDGTNTGVGGLAGDLSATSGGIPSASPSIYGGAGGNGVSSASVVGTGGNSVYGGAGGGSSITPFTAGTSKFGGDGGAGAYHSSGAGDATAGSVPGGGGGAVYVGTGTGSSGAGGAGQIIVTEFY